MDIYSKIKDCDESELFDLVMSDDNLHVDGSFGLIEYLKPNYPELENLYQLDDEGEKLLRIAEVIVGHKLLFVTQSNGSDTLAFKVVSDTSYDQCIKQFGMPFAENYVPVDYLPNLWNSAGDKIESASQQYATQLLSAKPSKKWWQFWQR